MRYFVSFIKSQFKIFSPIFPFSLFLWAFFLPLISEAGALSFLFGEQAVASINVSSSSQPSNSNSQNMVLLEANVFSVSVLGEKNSKGAPNKKADSVNIDIVSNTALLPTTGPLSIGGENSIGGPSFDQVSVYVVRSGDSISQIAEMFEVSVNTILAANDMKRGDTLKEGDVLVILPISGLEHTVVKGQTLESLAKLYKVDVIEITSYNGITADEKLAVGDKLTIPGGEMADEGGDKPASDLNTAEARDKNYYAANPIKSVTGYFINPLPTGRKTQGLHGPGRRGIDIGAPTGTPIYASASGTVLIAKTGWSGGYGNMAIIQHSNGTKTLYAHMSKLGAYTGAQVSQGGIIGYVGSTGKSTGPHLHFEVFNAKNPGADWSWKR